MYSLFAAPHPPQNGQSLKHFNSMLCKVIMFAVFLTFLFISGNEAKAQSPVNCNGTLNCYPPSEWSEEIQNVEFQYDACNIVINFRYAICGSSYVIDITSIRTFTTNPVGPCFTLTSSIVNEAIKLAIVKLNQLVSLPYPMMFDIVVKTQSCVQDVFLPDIGETLTSCSEDCCVTRYSIKKNFNGILGLSIISQITEIDGNQTFGCGTPCNAMCSQGHSIAPGSIYFSDYLDGLCELDCFWKLDGNGEVEDYNFIGPTNGEDFVIKTKQTEGGNQLLERIRVDNNRRIDFKLNSWNAMPQISFDSHPDGVTLTGDPIIKLYRPTGNDPIPPTAPFHSFPWWISIGSTRILPTQQSGAFNIWSGPAESLVGQEYADPSSMTRKFTILPNGNVGIGVINPREELVVVGTICAEEVRVSLSGLPCWPDYVFGDNYKLRDLSELELYIKKNKSLPDIPTAEEVTNSGVELGDMQARMLRKIEELTLYIIELKKENEEIKKIIITKKEK